MRIWICLFLLVSLGLLAWAGESVSLSVVSQRAAQTADPNGQLYEYTVKVTNSGDKALQLSNNQFFVLDSAGGKHFVDRVKRPQQVTLAPGKSETFDRIYITVPRSLKPVELHLRKLGSVPVK